MQNGHLQGFGYFALRHGAVPDGAQYHGLTAGGLHTRFAIARVVQPLAFEVSQGMGHARGRNGLHARSRALMGNNRDAGPPQRRVRIIGSATAERVVGLGQQLQHELIRPQAQAQQQSIIAVIRRGIVGFGEQEGGRQLHGLVAPGSGVHVARGHGFLFFVERGHFGGGVHQVVSAGEQGGIGGSRGRDRSRGRGEDHGGSRSRSGHAGIGKVSSIGSGGRCKIGHRKHGAGDSTKVRPAPPSVSLSDYNPALRFICALFRVPEQGISAGTLTANSS